MNFSSTFSKPLFALGLSLSLFACGEKKTEQPKEQAPATTAETAPTPKFDKTLTVAITQDFAPFTYLDDKGLVIGFDVDVIKSIGNKKGFNVDFKPVTFDNIFTEIENKTADVGASAIFYKEERASKYGLTKPYHTDRPVYFYRADNAKLANANPSSVSDLNEHKLNIAVVGSVDGLNNGHNIETVKSEFVGFLGVIQGKYDVSFSDESVLKHAIKSNPDSAKIELKSVPYQGDVGYVMVVNKENADLLNTLNEGIDELYKNGEIKQFQQKHGLE